MIVERENNEIVVRLSATKRASEIQAFLNYLRYEELTAESSATQKDADDLIKRAKKGRWEKTSGHLGLK